MCVCLCVFVCPRITEKWKVVGAFFALILTEAGASI